eukprot:1157886-Pelagomonas_calceolata.AAC.1
MPLLTGSSIRHVEPSSGYKDHNSRNLFPLAIGNSLQAQSGGRDQKSYFFSSSFYLLASHLPYGLAGKGAGPCYGLTWVNNYTLPCPQWRRNLYRSFFYLPSPETKREAITVTFASPLLPLLAHSTCTWRPGHASHEELCINK